MNYIVKLAKASSPSGVAYIGPGVADGFKTEDQRTAYRFDSEFQANRFANHFRKTWRGFWGFDPDNITVKAA